MGSVRFVLGPWRWMLLVYVVLEPGDRVVVVTIRDACSSTAATDPRHYAEATRSSADRPTSKRPR